MEKKSEKATKVTVPSIANDIWEDIKDKGIEMFALPNQVVSMYVSPVDVEPSKLYLRFTASAVLPSLEVAVGNKYSVERVDKFIVVAKK
jgi:hypothetical protein